MSLLKVKTTDAYDLHLNVSQIYVSKPQLPTILFALKHKLLCNYEDKWANFVALIHPTHIPSCTLIADTRASTARAIKKVTLLLFNGWRNDTWGKIWYSI